MSTAAYLLAHRGRPRLACESVAGRLRKAIGARSFDAVIGHGAYAIPAAGVAMAWSRETGIPYFAFAHGSDINFARPAAIPYLSSVFEGATGAFFVSDALRARAATLGICSAKGRVLPNGVDRTIFLPPDGPRHVHGPIALFVGNLVEVKGADRLPAIMDALWRVSPGFRLVVVGQGPLRSQLETAFAGKPVDFRGSVPRAVVAQEMGHADVLLLPSRSEGWPCVVLEAQSCGTPVVATDVGGVREAIGSGGIIVENADFSAPEFSSAAHRAVGGFSRDVVRARTRGFDWRELGSAEAELIGDLLTKRSQRQ